MNYYIVCKKILGEKEFEKLINQIARDLEFKLDKNIIIEEFVKILEINIRVIMVIAFSKILGFEKNVIEEKLHIKKTKKYMVTEDVQDFESKYKHCINKLVKKLEIK